MGEENKSSAPSQFFFGGESDGEGPLSLVLRHRAMPTLTSGDINWDEMCDNYFDYVLSPLHPVMLEHPEPRNGLVRKLGEHARSAGHAITVADFGCGIGSLLPHLQGIREVRAVTGVDQSESSLRVAQNAASQLALSFNAMHGDIRKIRLEEPVDIGVVVNSVLPSERHEVLELLTAIAGNIKHGGCLMGIFPSFDTTQYLFDLWQEECRKASGSEEYGQQIREALALAKKVDTAQLRYADDGVSQQCYHTKESLREELPAAGFAEQIQIEKVYYPWELAKRFDYGYFPGAPEEIWDWLVVARRR